MCKKLTQQKEEHTGIKMHKLMLYLLLHIRVRQCFYNHVMYDLQKERSYLQLISFDLQLWDGKCLFSCMPYVPRLK